VAFALFSKNVILMRMAAHWVEVININEVDRRFKPLQLQAG
jgi:hypothetical protein